MVSANQKLGNGPASAGGEEPKAREMGNQKQGRWVTKRDRHTLPCGGEQHEDETPKHEWGLIGILGL